MNRNRRPALGVLLGALLLAVGCTTVPITGRTQLQLVSEDHEIALGLSAFQEVMSKAQLSDNAAANAIVERVARRISKPADAYLRQSGRKEYGWEVRLVRVDQANAFALPGGKIVVYDKILGVMANEAQLATVLAHEVGHALARHGAERMSQNMVVGLGAAALGVATRNEDAHTRTLVMAVYGLGSAVGYLLPYSRQHEKEADYIGLVLMAEAGYDPQEAVAFWARFAEAKKGQSQTPEFLSTHPADATRIRLLTEQLPAGLRAYAGATRRYGKGVPFR